MAEAEATTKAIERAYAHFHRVLAALLTDLVAETTVTWLAEPGHELIGDHGTNTYNPAVYVTDSLVPYRDSLRELDEVQADILDLTGREQPGRNLLAPLVRDQVSHVRLSRYTGQTGRTISIEAALRRMEQLEETVQNNLREFEHYARRHDPARKEIEAELRDLQRGMKLLEKSGVQQLREVYLQTVIRPYVYFEDGGSEQLHMRNSGLIVAGPNISVDWRQGPRRTRSDKIRIEPLVSAGALRFYDQKAWDAARAR